MSNAWWFPMVALGVITISWVITAGVLSHFISLRSRRLLGAALISILAVSAVIAYSYMVIKGVPIDPAVEWECLGAPYEVC